MVYKINYRKYEIGKNRTKTKEKCFDFYSNLYASKYVQAYAVHVMMFERFDCIS